MQCPVCGREVERLIDGMCARCLSERATFVSIGDHADSTACAHCGRVQRNSTWKEAPHDREERLRQAVLEHLEIDPRLSGIDVRQQARWENEMNARVQIQVRGTVEGEPVVREAQTRVRFKAGACPDCSREVGGYFEAVIQVRGSEGSDLSRLLPEIDDKMIRRMENFRREGRPGAFFSRVDVTRNGKDYYSGSQEAARLLSNAMAEEYGAQKDESSKLVGKKDGRDLLRFTFLVRLPPYAIGDFVLLQDAPYKVLGFDKRTLHLLDVQRHQRVRRDLGRAGPVKIIGRASDEREGIIVSRHGANVQVMDPQTFRTHDLPANDVPAQATSVPLFWWEERPYLVLVAQTKQ